MMNAKPLVSKKPEFTEVINVPSSSVLMHCRTVVEKKDFVSTGLLTVVEGDMLEIEIGDYQRFDLGDSVKVTIYTPAGIYLFNSTIIAKDVGLLMVINPPENQRKFHDKRQYPRVEVSGNGMLSVADHDHELAEIPIELQVKNISVSGIGFMVSNEIKLPENTLVSLELNLGTQIDCTAEIVRSESSELGIFYGAKYVSLPDHKVNSLRAYILKAQVESHSSRKVVEGQKRRIFK